MNTRKSSTSPSASKSEIVSKIKSYIDKVAISEKIPHLPYAVITEGEGKAFSNHFKKKIIDHKTIYNILTEIVLEEVIKVKDTAILEAARKISDIPSVNARSLTNKIYQKIKRLPIVYEFIFPLGNKNIEIASKQITDTIELLTLTDKDIKKYGTVPWSQKLFNFEKDLEKGEIIFRFLTRGYVSDFKITKLVTEDPLYLFKVIIGIYVSLDILQILDSPVNKTSGLPIDYRYKVYDKNKFVTALNESTEDSIFISKLSFSTKTQELSDLDKLLKKTTTYFENANIDLKKILEINKLKKKRVKGLMKNDLIKYRRDVDKLTEHGLQIRNAAYWYYESLKTTQKHAEIIYLVTAFDSLLGEPDDDMKTKKDKANIISNAISTSAIELETIKEYIGNLYNLRNNIIHGKKPIYELLDYNKPYKLEEHPFILALTCKGYFKRLLAKRFQLLVLSIAS